MVIRVGNMILRLAAVLCVWSAITVPPDRRTEGILTFTLAFFLLLRPYQVLPQSITTFVGGCILVAIVVAGNRGLINYDKLAWVAVMVLGYFFFLFGGRIENWLKRVIGRRESTWG